MSAHLILIFMLGALCVPRIMLLFLLLLLLLLLPVIGGIDNRTGPGRRGEREGEGFVAAAAAMACDGNAADVDDALWRKEGAEA